MPRVFVGNFDFEHELADPHYQSPARLKRLNAELAAGWLAIAEDGDLIWTPEPIEPAAWEALRAQVLPRVTAITAWDNLPEKGELVPWGWTDRLRRLASRQSGGCAAPPDSVVRAVNSRRFSAELEAEWKCGLPGTTCVTTLDQFELALSLAREISSRIVIKANWSMSARERIFVHEQPTEAHLAWIRQRIAQQGLVTIEPWVERLEEIGIQMEVPVRGAPQLIGVTPLVCDAAGQYAGSWFTTPPDAGLDFQDRWQPAVDIALRAAERMRSLGYFGPLGIDALRYRLRDGTIQLRPLQDINARWTMGRLSLGWRLLLRPRQYGFWQHSSGHSSDDWLMRNVELVRRIPTSPDCIGGQPVHHQSCVLIGAPIEADDAGRSLYLGMKSPRNA